MRFGENPREVIARVKARLHDIEPGLPKGVEIVRKPQNYFAMEQATKVDTELLRFISFDIEIISQIPAPFTCQLS